MTTLLITIHNPSPNIEHIYISLCEVVDPIPNIEHIYISICEVVDPIPNIEHIYISICEVVDPITFSEISRSFSVKMKRRITASLAFVLSVIDISVSTVLYSHGSQFIKQFKLDILHFTYNTSMFDLWILGIIRVLVYLGSLLALAYNPVESLWRIRKTKRLTVILMVMFWMYSIIKLMISSESTEPRDSWFFALFAWSFVSAMLFPMHFAIIRSVTFSRNVKTLLINETSVDDTEALLNNGDCNHGKQEDENSEKSESVEPKASKVTIGTMISYTKPDLPYLLLAFVFLLTAAVGNDVIVLYPITCSYGCSVKYT